MGWATNYINELKEGKTIQFRPYGGSMVGRINSGELVTVEPISGELSIGDIVLCKVNGNQYLHLIKCIRGKTYLIGNNRGGINGWVGIEGIYGKCIKVE
jgi:hypothetical protein